MNMKQMFWRKKLWTFSRNKAVIFRLITLKLARLSQNIATAIVKYSWRKDCQQVFAVKKYLRKTKMEDVDLPGQNKLFINKNFCPYYKVLWSKSKKLHSFRKINSFFISGDIFKIKVIENSLRLSITNVNDFGKVFLDIDLSPPERCLNKIQVFAGLTMI